MPYYVRRGTVPAKRHIVHKPRGEHTYEELISRQGFSDVYSNAYHLRMPTRVRAVGAFEPRRIAAAEGEPHRHRHLRPARFEARGDWVDGRRYLAFNDDVAIAICHPAEEARTFYRNAQADELLFVHDGAGELESLFGRLAFGPGDYLVIPRGVTCRLVLQEGPRRLFVVESRGPIEIPRHYRNQHGQLLEDAPYCERDLRAPQFVEPREEEGSFAIRVKLGAGIQHLSLAQHPFDLVGWDGCYYPWAFHTSDFMPAVGKVHLPPPVHQSFAAPGFVVCTFVPRLFDFHEQAIPIPYAHSNVDSDEVLYYAEGSFMSRKGIERGSLTLHPMGYPHGPQPGLLERSLGARETRELAVMVDTFAPLRLSAEALEVDDEAYPLSWLEEEER